MAGSDKLFVDSNYFIALSNPSDILHRDALEIATILEHEKPFLVISSFIFLEVVTVLAQKRGKDTGVETGAYLLTNTIIENIHIDDFLQKASWDIFQKIENKNVSFVDCSTIAVMKAEQINALLTFDRHDFQRLRKYHRFHLYRAK